MSDKLDPTQQVELATLRQEYQKRFQGTIDYVKSVVGAGIEYRNDVARIVVSDNGAYCELLDLPEEFCGAGGDQVTRRFVAPEEAISLLASAAAAVERASFLNTREFSLLALYSRTGVADGRSCFLYEFRATESLPSAQARTIGQLRPGVMPSLYKIRLSGELGREVLGSESSIVICMSNAGDRNLLVSIDLSRAHYADLTSSHNSPTTN